MVGFVTTCRGRAHRPIVEPNYRLCTQLVYLGRTACGCNECRWMIVVPCTAVQWESNCRRIAVESNSTHRCNHRLSCVLLSDYHTACSQSLSVTRHGVEVPRVHRRCDAFRQRNEWWWWWWSARTCPCRRYDSTTTSSNIQQQHRGRPTSSHHGFSRHSARHHCPGTEAAAFIWALSIQDSSNLRRHTGYTVIHFLTA